MFPRSASLWLVTSAFPQKFDKYLLFTLNFLRSREAREIPFVVKSEHIFTEPEIPKEIPERIRYMDSFTLSDDDGESEVILNNLLLYLKLKTLYIINPLTVRLGHRSSI